MTESRGVIVYGSTAVPGEVEEKGTATKPFRTDPTGGTTQPISATELPLPTGAATGAKQDTGNVALANIDATTDAALDATLSSRATETTLSALNTKTPADPAREGGNLATLAAKDFATQTTLASIDTKVATAAKQDTGNSSLSSIDGKVATETTLALVKAKTDFLDVALSTRALESGGNLATAASKLTAIDGHVDANLSTRATEATLLAADGRLTTIDAVLDAIKDTTGIKKITDQLPAGTNEIGKVAQGTKVAGSGAWPQVLYDAAGNAVGVVLDGAVYRLQAQAKIVRASDGAQINPATNEQQTDGTQKSIARGGAKGATTPADVTSYSINADHQALDVHNWGLGTGNSQQVEGLAPDGSTPVGNPVWVGGYDGSHVEALDTVSGTGRLKATLYTPDGDPVSFASTSSSIKHDFVKNVGSDNLLVNGSVTPVLFEYLADGIYDISLQEIKFTIVSNSVTFGSGYFGATAGPLANGLLVQVITHGVTVTLYNLIQNESFVNFASPGGFEWVVSSKDLLSTDLLVGGGLKLEHGSVDKVVVTVRDNLTAAGVYFKCFIKGNLLGA